MNSASALAKKRAKLKRNVGLIKLQGKARRALAVSLALPEQARPLAQNIVAEMPGALSRLLGPCVAGTRPPADFFPTNRLLKALCTKIDERQAALLRRRMKESDAASVARIAAHYGIPPDIEAKLRTALTKGNDAVRRIFLEEGEAEQLLKPFRDAASEVVCNSGTVGYS